MMKKLLVLAFVPCMIMASEPYNLTDKTGPKPEEGYGAALKKWFVTPVETEGRRENVADLSVPSEPFCMLSTAGSYYAAYSLWNKNPMAAKALLASGTASAAFHTLPLQ